MKEIILCKYGELVLKGANRSQFEAKLIREIRRRAHKIGHFNITHSQSTVYIEASDDESDIVEMYTQAKKIYGFAGLTMAAVAEKNMDDICRVAREYLPDKLAGAVTFRCEAKRSDKRFPLKSPEIAEEVGGVILDVMPHLKVNLREPDVTVRIEVREQYAYIHAGQDKGAGGIPVGTGGRAMLLLSGGIDSPVAGCMMAKRGLYIDALHFESFPYTSERAREKVIELAGEMSEYCGPVRVNIISLTKIQEMIRDTCDEDYFTLLLRRFMMKLATRCAVENDCTALVTGESLGQVASQTLQAISVTEESAGLPILRPCIGLDKEEIIVRARELGTFDTSILPYEDCCTVFTPRHPRTRPVLEKVVAEEEKLDCAALIDEAWETRCFVIAGGTRPF